VEPKKKGQLHPRNRHPGHYDFKALARLEPSLAQFVAPNAYGSDSIDFTEPLAVKALNRALLISYYGLKNWDIPKNALCPAIPGRADYIHSLADLLAGGSGGVSNPSKGKTIRVLDIGTGANGIFPILGFFEYGWSFVGADVNPNSIQSFGQILAANPELQGAVELRMQVDPKKIFRGIIRPGEFFSASMCNPTFHSSPDEARGANQRKWKKLGRTDVLKNRHEKQAVNFGGEGAELWCEGGELEFLKSMIQESQEFQQEVGWFTTLVSKSESLGKLEAWVKAARVRSYKVLPMEQGQKKSRIFAWSFTRGGDRE
jgi:23S rRNA (adenine1618-N6)-methyltransferase